MADAGRSGMGSVWKKRIGDIRELAIPYPVPAVWAAFAETAPELIYQGIVRNFRLLAAVSPMPVFAYSTVTASIGQPVNISNVFTPSPMTQSEETIT